MSIFTNPLISQDALNRSVQVSAKHNPFMGSMDFSWPWDWSEGGYTIYRKHPDSTHWGQPIAELPWGSTSFSDPNFGTTGTYEYAFYKKEFEEIKWETAVAAGQTLVFSIENIYGNGLCCNFGHGWYLTQACGQTLSGGSDFGFSKKDTIQICDNGNPTELLTITINPDMLTNNTWWKLKTLDGQTVDSSGVPGTNLAERPKFGYILAGIEQPVEEFRGTLLLVIDDAYGQPLANEIDQLKQDLWADGWKIKTQEVNRNDQVGAIKSLIANAFQQTPDLKMVYLLGHVPVPYSGSYYADGHIESHWGAWPADVFYGEMDGAWTDNLVENTSASFPRNHNIPGDGKFDQSSLPSPVELAVGRVDLFDMPAFTNDDVELTRRYLNKAHQFKMGELNVARRGLVDDNLGIALGAPAASGWRNFAPMFTADSVRALDYFSTMKNDSYLLSFGGGSGSFTSANGIGNTQDFVNDTLKNIFTMLCGSYFGDWNNPDNFLRAPLASAGWTLTSSWAGNPPFTLHRMAMGEPIGQSLLRTQNATETDYYPGPQLVHTALMGDPSLRLHPVKPITGLSAITTSDGVELNWTAPTGETIAGYNIYRADSLFGELQKVNTALVSATSYLDPFQPADSAIYMVRAVKLESSGSGSYWNMSLGVADWSTSLPCEGENIVTEQSFSICEGQSLEYDDSTYTEPGLYEHLYEAVNGCDSLVLVYLLVESAPIAYFNTDICEGEDFEVGDTILTSSGIYELDIFDDNGCLQHLVVNLTVNPVYEVNIDSNYIPPIVIDGQAYTDDFTVTIVATSNEGCDSIIHLNFHALTDVVENVALNNFLVYPNPNSGSFFIEQQRGQAPLMVEIWDGLGQLVFSKELKSLPKEVVQPGYLPSGAYWLKIKGTNGQLSRKLILIKS